MDIDIAWYNCEFFVRCIWLWHFWSGSPCPVHYLEYVATVELHKRVHFKWETCRVPICWVRLWLSPCDACLTVGANCNPCLWVLGRLRSLPQIKTSHIHTVPVAICCLHKFLVSHIQQVFDTLHVLPLSPAITAFRIVNDLPKKAISRLLVLSHLTWSDAFSACDYPLKVECLFPLFDIGSHKWVLVTWLPPYLTPASLSKTTGWL